MCTANLHMQDMALPPKPWPTGVAEQCEPLVRRVLAPNPSPYTYTGTQTYVVGAGDEVAVIDPARMTQRMWMRSWRLWEGPKWSQSCAPIRTAIIRPQRRR